MNKLGPIKPEDVQSAKDATTPQAVLNVFNQLIVNNWDGVRAKFTKLDAQTAVAAALHITSTQVFERNLLDAESIYRKAGWIVDYDSPGYNEDYAATYTFSKRTP